MSLSTLSLSRHLATELLAYTVVHLFPNVLCVGGGTNSLGFYYDFVFEQPLTAGMIEFIEVHLRTLIKEERPLRSLSMMRENAQSLFEHHGQPLLAYRAGQYSENIIDLIQIEAFYGLCPEHPFTSTHEAGVVKLLDQSEYTQQIQDEEFIVTRLTGTNQENSQELKQFLKRYDAFRKRQDHRILGPQLHLFHFSGRLGSLGVVWEPKGMRLRQILQEWITRQLPQEVQAVSTPAVVKRDFFKKDDESLESFHFEEEAYQLIPSLTRQHVDLLRHLVSDPEDLPYRIAEQAMVYHAYPESQQWGLLCACASLVDQTTICCAPSQILTELISSLHFIEQIFRIFDFKAHWCLIASRHKSPRARQEQEAIGWLKQAIQTSPRLYSDLLELQEEEGDGPRLELRVTDVIGREWPLSVISIVQHVPAMKEFPAVIVTRHLWGSFDRLIALLIERYEGEFPLWLAPEQVRVLTIGEANQAYAKQVTQQLQQRGVRVGLDQRQAKLNQRVHEAEKEKVPYLVLIGDQERAKQGISVRAAGRSHHTRFVDLEAFLDKLYQESLCPSVEG